MSPWQAAAAALRMFVPSSSGDPSEASDERELDWEDYNYLQEPAADGRRQAENPLAALLAGIPDFTAEELKALLQDLPTQDDANQVAVMTLTEARR